MLQRLYRNILGCHTVNFCLEIFLVYFPYFIRRDKLVVSPYLFAFEPTDELT
jgi:hypothetical protein